MRWPFVVSLAAHTGGLVALCVVHSRAGSTPAHPVELTCLRADECDRSPETPVPPAFELPEVESVELDRIEAEAEAEEPEEIEFPDFASADPSPPPLPLRPRVARIPPLRRPAARRADPPAPAIRAEAARVTTAVPRGDRCTPPSYPAAAQRKGIEGRVVLRVLVGCDGSVLSVEIESSSGSSVLDDAAVAAVRDWTFEPAHDGTSPVESLVSVPFRFRLRS